MRTGNVCELGTFWMRLYGRGADSRAALIVVPRRLFWFLLAAGIVLSGPSYGAMPTDPIWQSFKTRYVRDDGRVVDSGNADITHSESQGFGMLFAEYFGDRPAFDSIRTWVEEGIRWNGASLHAWKWVRDAQAPVPDPNNATDGDLLIGWALERASRRWNEPRYLAAARLIAADVRRLLTARDSAGRLVLLPAFQGFDVGGTTLNLSYYVFPAIEAFRRIDPSPVWDELLEDGLQLIEAGGFGRWDLPPDWLFVASDGTLQPALKWPARFGFDAVRVPLYLVWAGVGSDRLLQPFRDFWRSGEESGRIPAWVDLEDDESSPYGAARGARSVATLVLAQGPIASAALPSAEAAIAEDYYSASLAIMARIAAEERGGRAGRGTPR